MKGDIKVTCSCGKAIIVPPAMAGLNIRCRNCWNTLRVPLPDGTPLPERRTEERRAVPEPAAPPPNSAAAPFEIPIPSADIKLPEGAREPAGSKRPDRSRRMTDRRSTPVVDPNDALLHRRVWAKGSEAVRTSFLAKFLVFLAFVGIAFCIYMSVRASSQSAALEPLRPHLQEYLAAGAESPYPQMNVYAIKGRVVVVDMDARDFDPIFFDIPAAKRAEKPGDVGTVVQIKKEGKSWGIKFIDVETDRVTWSKYNPGDVQSEKPAGAFTLLIKNVPMK